MVWDKKTDQPTMHPKDWELFGHQYMKNGVPTLPTIRFDIPIPPTADGLHSLAHRLAGLSEALHRSAREGRVLETPRLALMDAKMQVREAHLAMRTLRQEWERILRENLEDEEKNRKNRERLRAVP